MEDIILKLKVKDANLIIAALVALPYSQVHELVQNIRDQGNTQLPSSEIEPASEEESKSE